METVEIITKLEEYIGQEILKKKKRSLDPDEALLSSGIVDSFHLVDLGIFIEDSFGVRIKDFELNSDTFDSLRQLADIIKTRMG
jgi:acyl carrier protein